MAASEGQKQRRLKVVANRAACCGYALCSEICPEVYALDDNGFVVVKHELAPLGLEDKARDGADACPQNALAVEWVEV